MVMEGGNPANSSYTRQDWVKVVMSADPTPDTPVDRADSLAILQAMGFSNPERVAATFFPENLGVSLSDQHWHANIAMLATIGHVADTCISSSNNDGTLDAKEAEDLLFLASNERDNYINVFGQEVNAMRDTLEPLIAGQMTQQQTAASSATAAQAEQQETTISDSPSIQLADSPSRETATEESASRTSNNLAPVLAIAAGLLPTVMQAFDIGSSSFSSVMQRMMQTIQQNPQMSAPEMLALAGQAAGALLGEDNPAIGNAISQVATAAAQAMANAHTKGNADIMAFAPAIMTAASGFFRGNETAQQVVAGVGTVLALVQQFTARQNS